MNMYKEIDQETMELLLDALLKRTLEGKQIWENLYYNPIGFVQQDAYEDKGAYISQMFETTTSFKEEMESLKESLDELFEEYQSANKNPADSTLEEGMQKVIKWDKERQMLLAGNPVERRKER